MSTSPRARARPRIDSETVGSTIPGHSVTMSMRIALQLEQSLRRPDDDPARVDVHLHHDLGDGRDQVLAPGAAHDPEIVSRRRLDAAHLADRAPVVRHHAAPYELPRVHVTGWPRQRPPTGQRD